MERIKLIGTNLATLESEYARSGKAYQIYWGTEIKGFGLRFRSRGVGTWIYQYKFNGADQRYRIGPYPDMIAKVARALVQDKRADVWKGINPQAVKREEKAKAKAQAQAQ